MATLTDIGLDLWVLVHHLYRKHGGEPAAALRELTLRTRCTCPAANDGDGDGVAERPSAVRGTKWFQDVARRYGMLRQRLRDARQDDLAEAAEVARSLYPAGCAVPEYVNALQTCAAMLSSTVPSHTVARFAEHRVADLVAQGRETVTADELLSDLIERPLLDAVTPPQWWLSDAECAGAASVKSVRLRAQPTQILIVYDWCGRLRHRRIHLAGVLHENGPTAPLAKRLARVHGALIKEERFLAYLLRLQGLMKESAVHSGKGSASDAVLTQTQGKELWTMPVPTLEIVRGTRREVGPSNASASAAAAADDDEDDAGAPTDSVVNKADVGLLYRNPEEALNNVDLNDADDVTLREFKAKMEEKFVENAVRPGDPGYVYDKRLEVKPTERSEWDDSD